MKNVIIKQGAGIGDILFSLKIAKIIHEKYGSQIIWPLHTFVLKELREYIKVPYIKWVDEKDYDWLNNYKYFTKTSGPISSWVGPHVIKINNDTIIFPLCEAAQTPTGKFKGGSIMCQKYETFKLSFENWQDSIVIQRNKEKEEDLFYNVLQLNDEDEYTYVHRKFNARPGLPVDSLFMPDVIIKPVGKVVEGNLIPGFCVFDWLKVFENAKDIHVVSTSLFYILEALDKKLPEIKIYNRNDNNDLTQLYGIKPTLRQKWKFVEKPHQTTYSPGFFNKL